MIFSSRQRRLNSVVADATRRSLHRYPALKRRANISRRYGGEEQAEQLHFMFERQCSVLDLRILCRGFPNSRHSCA